RLALDVLGPRGSGVSGVVVNLARGATEGMMSKAKVYLGAALAAGLAVVAGGGWISTASGQQELPPVVNLPLQGAPAVGVAMAAANLPLRTWEYLYVGQPE